MNWITLNLNQNLLKKVLSVAIIIGSLPIIIMLFCANASALDGNPSTELPNNPNNANKPWSVVTRPGTNGMDSPSSSVRVYLPLGQATATFAVKDACDTNPANDVNPGNNQTYFWIRSAYITSITSNSTGTSAYGPIPGWWSDYMFTCEDTSLSYDSIITVTIANPNDASTFTETINGEKFKYFQVTALTHTEANTDPADPKKYDAYYMNKFRVDVSSISPKALVAFSSSFEPQSSSDYTGIAANDSTGSAWGWSTKVNFALKCNVTYGFPMRVFFYDTDYRNNTGDPSSGENPKIHWQNQTHPMYYSIKIYDRRNYADAGYATSTGGVSLNAQQLKGGNSNRNNFNVGKDQTLDFIMDSRYIYSIEVFNINNVNSLQMAVPLPGSQLYAYDRCTGGQPVGFIDSCYLDGSNTVILGWAYDDDVSGSKPDVRLSVTGQPDTTYQTNEANYYRVPQIENFLNTGGYGSNNRDGVYGFKATYTGLYVGGNYSISGTVINSGPNGSDVPIGVNTTNSSLGFYFINGKIPNSCLSNSASQVICSTPIKTVWVGEEFYIETSVSNNSSSAVTLAGPATYQITQPVTGTVLRSGNGLPYISSSSPPYQSFPYNLPANSSVTIRSDQTPPPINLSSVGTYGIKWDVPIGSGLNAGGDCGAVQPKLLAHSVPYTRFYGNDVIAGGGYGDCSATSGINANGYGEFGTPADQTTYRGTASELAVFASGAINGVMPGSQSLIARNPVNELAFANDPSTVDLTTGGLNSPAFGGSFGPTICASDFWNQVPDKTQLTTLPSSTVNLGTLSPGTYYYLGNINITPANINNGTKITIYVDGDTIIGSATADALNSNNPNKYNQTVSYNQPNSSWSDIDKIPLIRIISKGNIYIDNNMSQVDGMYIAVSKDDGSGGEIQTCAQYTSTLFNDLSANDQASKTFIASECNHKLTVYGAFVAKKVKLLRTNGNVLSGVARETSDSANIAESFVFSPELYLALIADSTAAAGFDAILSLPPAL